MPSSWSWETLPQASVCAPPATNVGNPTAGESAIAADWSRLPIDLIEKIAGTLDEDIADRVRFGAVCRAWQSAVKPTSNLPPVRLPWLCIQDVEPDDERYRSDFFSLGPKVRYDLLLNTSRLIVACSPHGWILTVDPGKTTWLMLNPVTKAQILLPPLPPSDRGEAYRCELVVTPDSLAVVMVGFSHGPILCHCRPLNPEGGGNAEDSWTEIFCATVDDVEQPTLADISNLFTYHQGRFFIFDARQGATSTVDPDTRQVVSLIPPMPGTDLWFPAEDEPDGDDLDLRRRYLIRSSSGEELYLLIAPSITTNEMFEVFVLDVSDRQQAKWSMVRDIGDEVLFVDVYGALATLAPRDSTICRRNCIVFLGASVPHDFRESTPYTSWVGDVFGLFDIGNGNTEELTPMNLECSPGAHHRWFLPSLS